jgi:hypothetical protein
MARKVLVVTTVAADDRQLSEQLRDVIEADAEVRVVAPAARIGKLDWLTNAEDDARAQAEQAADTTASAIPGGAAVTIDRTSHDTEPVQDIEDALRNFAADEIVLVTSPDGASTWLEDDAVRAALDRSGLPVRRVAVRSAA